MLDRYPPRAQPQPLPGPATVPTAPPPRGPATASEAAGPASPTAPASPSALSGAAPLSPASANRPLLSLERPFDVDEFSRLLGETQIRVEVPRDALPEVLRRVCDFMGFGIYVYSISVRPVPSELLKQFVVELQRVDYVASAGQWQPFREQGRSESPFGPGDSR